MATAPSASVASWYFKFKWSAPAAAALIDELAKIIPGRVHFILTSFFVGCRGCFVPLDLLTRGVGGLLVVLGGGGVVLERERGQGFFLRRVAWAAWSLMLCAQIATC